MERLSVIFCLLIISSKLILESHATSPLQLDWEYQTEDRGVVYTDSGSPPVAGSIVGAALDSAGNVYFGSSNSRFYCFGPTGKTNWVFHAGGGINSSPAIGRDGTIYFGSTDGQFHALNPTGSQRWSFSVASPTASVVAGDGTIYFGSYDSYFYALNPDGSLKWKFYAGATLFHTPAVGADGTIYFTSWNHNVYALNPDGTLQWAVSTGETVSPNRMALGSDGMIYVAGSGDHKQLMALTPRGVIKWFCAFEGQGDLTAPAIDSDGTLYLADQSHLYALDSGGTLKSSTIIDYGYYTTPTLSSEGTLFLQNSAMDVVAFSRTGQRLNRFTTSPGSLGLITTSPLIGPDQILYMGFGDGEFYALTTSAATLDVKWKFKAEDAFPGQPASGTATRLPSYIFSTPAVDPSGNIYFGAGNKKFYSLKPDGTTNWTFITGEEIQASPAIAADGTIYFGSGDHKFYALDAQGHEKWHYTAAGELYGSPAIAPSGTIYFGSRDSNLYALNSDGTVQWKFTTGGYVERPPVLGADGSIYFGSFDGYIYALHPDGTLKWRISTGQQTPAGALVGSLAIGSDNTIYAATGGDGQQLIAIRPDGHMQFSFRFAPPRIYSYSSAPAIGSDGTIYVGVADQKIYAVNADGTLKWSRDTGSYGFSSPTLSDDGFVYIGGGAMSLLVLNTDGQVVTNFAMSGPGMSGGTVSAPNLAANHKLYIGSGNGKLYAFTTSGGLQASAWPTAQANAQRTAQTPTLVRDVSAAAISGDSLRFNVSIYDQSVVVEASTDLANWNAIPFTRMGATIEAARTSSNVGNLFYRIRYEQ